MTPYLTCAAALELLEGFVDGELPVAEQVAVESHLRWCRVCDARVADMQLIGSSLREAAQVVAQAAPHTSADDHDLAAIQSGVLARVRAERAQSLGVQFRGLFVDMRFFWPALGATAAVVICLVAATIVFAAATATEPDSMADMIEMLAHPGSDENPLSLDSRLSAPRALDASPVLDSIMEDDAVYALSAVVTREGRVSNYELLLSERASVRRRDTAAETGDEAAAVMAAVKRSRFEPAQTRAGGTVAVNMVWLVTRTTVRSAQVAAVIPNAVSQSTTVLPRRSRAVPTPELGPGPGLELQMPVETIPPVPVGSEPVALPPAA